MKKFLFGVLALGLVITACNSKKKDDIPESAKQFVPTQEEVDSVSYLMGVNIGYNTLKRGNFGELNFEEFEKGVLDALKATGSPKDASFFEQFKLDPSKPDIINRFLEKRNKLLLAINKDKEDKFLEENKTKEGVVALENRLQYKLTEPGNENKPLSNKDTVWVRYKDTTLDGTVFDEVSADRNPVSFPLNRVIKAWPEGLKYVGEGGKITLYVPAELGYGENGYYDIEPNATLIFDVELVKVGKYVDPAPAEEKAVENK